MAYIEVQIDNHDAFLNTEKVMYLKAIRPKTTAVYLVDGDKVTVNLSLAELVGRVRGAGG